MTPTVTDRPREARIGTTFWVGRAIHTVTDLVGSDTHGAVHVRDHRALEHRITYDRARRAWVGVPCGFPAR